MSAWFTVSLLALTYGHGQSVVITAIIGISSSLVTTLKGLVALPPLLHWHWSHRQTPRNHQRFWMYLSCGAFVVVAFVGIMVRFAGVWDCKSHVFQLSQMSCLEDLSKSGGVQS
eukprot:gnl/MRDRNA2_/MRDRNA2_230284_c0_seq1.p1 gnl/MRDRNA2_/MRDRNA2_230284_c0~~gnl/MRDRNA2_/MRDRNA2_230284_c0_seq1.p1  ORF type:complete len:127 (+),score=11.74 gnl/MRDRNA2_/MRDRNA2_230284_c0_seq1:40-381(+)